MPSGGYKCTGTKRISINEGEYSSADGDAQISIYQYFPPDDNDCCNSGRRSPASRMSSGSTNSASNRLSIESTSDHDCLHVFITDGVHTFYSGIISKDIRHMPSEAEEGNELHAVSAILLRPDDEVFKVSYKRQRGQLFGGTNDSKNTTSIMVSIRKTCLNNVVRPVWEGSMTNIRHCFRDDLPLCARNALPESAQSDSASGLASSLMLGDTINKLHREIDALRTENKQLEANTLRWKSTSEKLSNQWEDEKSELTANFLTLFNEHKARHVETYKELERLKGKKLRIGGGLGDAAVSNRSGRKSYDSVYQDDDAQDFATYNAAEIDRLASGPGVKKRGAGGAVKKPDVPLSQASGFRNPHTGAKEYTNVQELFSSDEDDDTPMKM